MLKKQFMVALAAAIFSTPVFAGDHGHEHGSAPHWTYEGAEGPAHWGELDPNFFACSSGKNQSPINLADFTHAKLNPIKFDYKAGGDEIINNGHTIQVNYASGSTITVNGHTFVLKQFHAHAPSENQIDGESFAMEFHFVHADEQGNLAVVALMFEEGEPNEELEKAWKAMPTEAGQKVHLEENVLGTALMPDDKSYYRFNGSLTTPPCSEGVTWLVLKEPVMASKEQVENFAHVMHHHNNRPVQPVNARLILE